MSTEQPLKSARGEIDCEDDLQAWIERGMESNGWTVLREVKARNSNYRADIVAKHKDIGVIGIECKHVTGGSIVAGEATRQIIEKYAGKKFFQWEVDAWGVCLFGREYRPKNMILDRRQREARRQIATTKRILNGLGIGYVTTAEDWIMMQFLPSGRSVHIPLFGVDSDIETEEVDFNRIMELINERRP
jgi:Holliday junction resolvase